MNALLVARTGRLRRWLPGLLLLATCGHGSSSNPAAVRNDAPAPVARDPQSQRTEAEAAVIKSCDPGGVPASDSDKAKNCCAALTSVGDALLAAGQKQAAYDQYETTRERCIWFHPVRRRIHELLHPPVPAAEGVSPTNLFVSVEVDAQLGDEIVLTGHLAYLDGEVVVAKAGRYSSLLPGGHQMTVELYIRANSKALGPPVRMDVKETLILPKARAGQAGLSSKLLVRLRDRGGPGTLAERLIIEKVLSQPSPSPTAGERVMLAPSVGSALRLSGPPPQLAVPPDPSFSGKTVWALYRVCVDVDGVVDDVHTMKSTDNARIDAKWVAEVRSWRYRPHMHNGQRHPFCTPVRLQVTFQ
ncbi:MAG TPA: hypothetical protein VGF45_15250 [Polyangia bacterium]